MLATPISRKTKKKTSKKSLRKLSFSPANFWITHLVEMWQFWNFAQSLGWLQGCLYQILSNEPFMVYFLVNFFLKMAIFKKSGLTRAFFGPNFFFQNHLSNGWVICTEPWTNCKCIYTPNFIFITVLKKDFSVRDYAPDQFRAPISSFILI